MVTDPVALPSQDLLAATQARRVELHTTICGLENALSAAALDPAWVDRTRRRLNRLVMAFHVHREASEGPDGLYAEVLKSTPRLSFAIEKLAAEHDDIDALLAVLTKLVADRGGAAVVEEADPWVERVRAEGTVLIALLTRHRQRGADLLYEAFAQDIGGCD